jgi:hypothetical protein
MQVLIRWALQRGTSCLPKSANPGRIASNFDVLDWQLRPEDQQALSTLLYRVSNTVCLTVAASLCRQVVLRPNTSFLVAAHCPSRHLQFNVGDPKSMVL